MLGPGWYAYPRLHTVSRYPILEPGGAKSVYAYLQVAPGRVVAVLNTHLPSAPYGPYGVRDGKGLARVLHNENVTRIPWMQPILAAARPLIAAGVPTLLTGDFNSPSWRDWTPKVVQPAGCPTACAGRCHGDRAGGLPRHLPHASPQRGQVARVHVAERMADVPAPRQYSDRIDIVWAGGPATALRSQIVGYPGSPYHRYPRRATGCRITARSSRRCGCTRSSRPPWSRSTRFGSRAATASA